MKREPAIDSDVATLALICEALRQRCDDLGLWISRMREEVRRLVANAEVER